MPKKNDKSGSFFPGLLLLLAGAASISFPSPTWAAEAARTNAVGGDVLLTGSMGHLVRVPTNQVHQGLLPSPQKGIGSQIPTPARGKAAPEAVQQRLKEARAGKDKFELFPSAQPSLMPYLASQDEYGNTAFHPDPLFPPTPLDVLAQKGKYWVSDYGLRYSLKNTFTYVSMTDVMKGDNSLGFYTFDFNGKWTVFNDPGSGSAGWLSAHIEAKSGLGENGQTQDAKRNLGSTVDPTGIWSKINGFRIPELAWQQSFREGEVVVVAGMVDQGNYFDGNSYANSGRGQFINSALIDSMVMPLPDYSFGANIQWQPCQDWYAMLGWSAGNGSAGNAPWIDFNWNQWALLAEVGYCPADVAGLGPGVYRIQPFIGQADGPVEGGLCFNLQQQLGARSPFGWFGRFGSGRSEINKHASAQIGTGFGMKAPLKYLGLFPDRENDVAGIGFVWSQPSATTKTIYHKNEYALETGYVLQLTPMAKLQPDFQVVWNPTFNPDPGPALVVQLQLVLSW